MIAGDTVTVDRALLEALVSDLGGLAFFLDDWLCYGDLDSWVYETVMQVRRPLSELIGYDEGDGVVEARWNEEARKAAELLRLRVEHMLLHADDLDGFAISGRRRSKDRGDAR